MRGSCYFCSERRLRRNEQFDQGNRHRGILNPNNHHFHVSQDQNSGRLHRQNYKGFVVLFVNGIPHGFEKFLS